MLDRQTIDGSVCAPTENRPPGQFRNFAKALTASTTALVTAVSLCILLGVLLFEGGPTPIVHGATCLILEHSDEYGQRGVTWTLGKMGWIGHDVLGRLVMHPDLAVRRVALHRIKRSGPRTLCHQVVGE